MCICVDGLDGSCSKIFYKVILPANKYLLKVINVNARKLCENTSF